MVAIVLVGRAVEEAGKMRRMADTVAARLARLTVLDGDGRAVTLGGFWDKRPAVLAFVRHFG
jgi:hypothetical protein